MMKSSVSVVPEPCIVKFVLFRGGVEGIKMPGYSSWNLFR